MVPSLLIAKIISTMVAVLGLSAIAERAGPAIAGIIAGVPLGLAIIFFFVGIQHGPDFVVESAPFAIGGLASTLCFNLAYWKASEVFTRNRLLASVVFAILAFMVAAVIINLIGVTNLTGTLLVVALIIFTRYAMRDVPAHKIGMRVKMTWSVLLIRAGLALAVVLAITEAAEFIGPEWAGLLTGFPVTLFPVLVIIHINYSVEDTHTILKGFPLGIPSLVIFALCCEFTWIPLGVPLGFVVSMAVSLLWLVGVLRLDGGDPSR